VCNQGARTSLGALRMEVLVRWKGESGVFAQDISCRLCSCVRLVFSSVGYSFVFIVVVAGRIFGWFGGGRMCSSPFLLLFRLLRQTPPHHAPSHTFTNKRYQRGSGCASSHLLYLVLPSLNNHSSGFGGSLEYRRRKEKKALLLHSR
jgi:hypothetical protein